ALRRARGPCRPALGGTSAVRLGCDLAWAWHGRRCFCGGGHRSRSRRELTRFGMRRSRDRTRTAEGDAETRHLGTVARRALILLRAQLFEERAGRDKNAVA